MGKIVVTGMFGGIEANIGDGPMYPRQCPECSALRTRAEKAEAEVERLRKLCVCAYNEGYEDGRDSVSRHNIGELRYRDAYWNDSITKADLDSAAGRGEGDE